MFKCKKISGKKNKLAYLDKALNAKNNPEKELFSIKNITNSSKKTKDNNSVPLLKLFANKKKFKLIK